MRKIVFSILLPFIVLSNASALAFEPSDYDDIVLQDNPVGYWLLEQGSTQDHSVNYLDGSFGGKATKTDYLPNGDTANAFNGKDNYFEIPDDDLLEITTTGILTIEAWMKPKVLQFKNSEKGGYVHWMGKGEENQHSWVSRMYNYTNDENRPNRISGYSFNLEGALGAGSYFQDPVDTKEWIHYTLIINTVDTSDTYPTGYTKIYKNGALRDQDSLLGYDIIPGNGTAPTRIATRDFNSFFKGSIGKVAIYDYELDELQLLRHFYSMRGVCGK
ncbi:LamG domain-containing protein [Vibrio kyushuensis]|uniref:LamG-like jellyroll fold domain-containing protein n=1 Tax=Vibrio kyushuensis TaxID=2910249 RepID=UPI003D0D0A90